VADLLWDALQGHLDYLADHQTAEGTWDPVWTWGDLYPKAWEQAKVEWRGHLTIANLVVLRSFGRFQQ
jgi:hypothetical protein